MQIVAVSWGIKGNLSKTLLQKTPEMKWWMPSYLGGALLLWFFHQFCVSTHQYSTISPSHILYLHWLQCMSVHALQSRLESWLCHARRLLNRLSKAGHPESGKKIWNIRPPCISDALASHIEDPWGQEWFLVVGDFFVFVHCKQECWSWTQSSRIPQNAGMFFDCKASSEPQEWMTCYLGWVLFTADSLTLWLFQTFIERSLAQ